MKIQDMLLTEVGVLRVSRVVELVDRFLLVEEERERTTPIVRLSAAVSSNWADTWCNRKCTDTIDNEPSTQGMVKLVCGHVVQRSHSIFHVIPCRCHQRTF